MSRGASIKSNREVFPFLSFYLTHKPAFLPPSATTRGTAVRATADLLRSSYIGRSTHSFPIVPSPSPTGRLIHLRSTYLRYTGIVSRPASPVAGAPFYLPTPAVSTVQPSLPTYDPSESLALLAPTSLSTSLCRPLPMLRPLHKTLSPSHSRRPSHPLSSQLQHPRSSTDCHRLRRRHRTIHHHQCSHLSVTTAQPASLSTAPASLSTAPAITYCLCFYVRLYTPVRCNKVYFWHCM